MHISYGVENVKYIMWNSQSICIRKLHRSMFLQCSIIFFLLFNTEGRKTFPRARRTQGNSFRSPVSFSPTDHSLSTSSGSSVFTPEYEDNRMRRRGSDIDNPTLSVMDISPPSRCKLRNFVNSNINSYLSNILCQN